MSAPLVSVVIPTYNGEAHLGEAIDAVLKQSLRDLELIVVDDGSTDRSRAVAEAAAARDPRVRVLPGGGLGLAGAPNLGLSACRGRFIALTDHDDISRPRRFEVQADYLSRHEDVDVLGGQMLRFGGPGVRVPQVQFPTRHEDLFARAFFECPVAKPTLMFRPSVVPEGGRLFNPADLYFEDYGAWVRLLLAGRRFATLPEVVLDYRVHGGQVSANYLRQQRDGAERAGRLLLETLVPEPSGQELALHRAALCLEWGRGLAWLEGLEAWFLKLRAASRNKGPFEPQAFDAVLAWRWTSALWANRGLGAPLYRLATASVLRGLPHPEPWKAWVARLGAFLPARATP